MRALSRTIRIFVDESIPHGRDVFSRLGEVYTFSGYELAEDPGLAVDAEVLVTRSVTRIDSRLLNGLPHLLVVASPTIGTDHVDFQALEEYRRHMGRPVPFYHAPGATASGVADFTLAGILLLCRRLGLDAREATIGVIGFGNCGSALGFRLHSWGIDYVACDPPRHEAEGFPSVPLRELLERCDIVTLHVPLTGRHQSRYPTFHMVDDEFLRSSRIRGLINTSRGAVVDTQALRRRLDCDPGLALFLDVWEGEPTPDPELVHMCYLSTPHCAGSVKEGRLRAVKMVYEQVARFLWRDPPPFPAIIPTSPLVLDRPDEERFLHMVGLETLSRDFKSRYLSASPVERGLVFDKMRLQSSRHEVVWALSPHDTSHQL